MLSSLCYALPTLAMCSKVPQWCNFSFLISVTGFKGRNTWEYSVTIIGAVGRKGKELRSETWNYFFLPAELFRKTPKISAAYIQKHCKICQSKKEHRSFMQKIIIKLATSQLCVGKHMIFLTSLDRQCSSGFSETDKKRLSWITWDICEFGKGTLLLCRRKDKMQFL